MAYPDQALLTELLRHSCQNTVTLPQLSELKDPAAAVCGVSGERRSGKLCLRRRRPGAILGRGRRASGAVWPRPAVRHRRADRRNLATRHRVAQPDALLLDRVSRLYSAALYDIDRLLDRP